MVLVVFLKNKMVSIRRGKESERLTRKMPLSCSRESTPLAKSWFLTLLQIISNLFLQSAIVIVYVYENNICDYTLN